MVYTHFSNREQSQSNCTNITASGGSISGVNISAQAEAGGTAVIATGHVTIERDPLAVKALEALEQQLEKAELREHGYQDQIKALTESVNALAKQKGQPDALLGLDSAMEQLAKGNTAGAETIFREVAEKKEAEGKTGNKEAAEALRHLGALAFLHDTQKALDAYRRATDLDPENWEGWNQFGHLLRRV